MTSTIYQFEDFTLDISRGCLLKAGAELKLRPKVYEALKYLVEHPGRLISKQELIHAVWPDTFVTDDSLVQCTVELRRALNDREQQLLKTVPRRGYLFTPSVAQHFAKTDIPSAAASSHPATGHQPSSQAARKLPDLPKPRTTLVGREQQVAEASDLLLRPDLRLLTMTGPGGAGKTRLALAVAAAIADHFSAGLQFVGLASITNPDLVGTALAKALDIQEVAKRTVPQLIADQLRDSGPFLLLLDNFEQVLSAATVVAETLTACPNLKVLVTSRSCLRIYGEQEFPVAPLPQNSAMELFAQRAAAVRPDFAITPENATAIQEVCSRLDGLPLAIELAAARTKVLSPSAMVDRLKSPLQWLTGGALDLPKRQQTLRNAIDWSHGLLDEAEQKLFRRVSVFAGGCTIQAAEAVCNTGNDLGMDLFEGLSSLVDKNLLQYVDRDGSEARFAMLETIREYALDRLAESGENTATRQAHAAYCLVLAEEGNPELGPEERTEWLSQCDAEIGNFRIALDWLFASGKLDWSLRLCAALFRFWDMREHFREGRGRLETVLHLAGTDYPKERARISIFLGALTTTQGDYDVADHFLQHSLSLYEESADQPGVAASLNALAVSARDRGDYVSAEYNFERSLACWRQLSDHLAIARCLHNLANVAKVCGNYARARFALSEATQIFEELGDRSGAAWSLNQQGDIAREQGDISAARDLYQRALSAFRDTGDGWGSARSLTDLGNIACEQSDYSAAHADYREALEIFAALGHRRGVARAMEGLACLAQARGNSTRALKLAAAGAHLRHIISAPLPKVEQLKLDQKLLPAWKFLSESQAKSAWKEGSEMTLEQAIQYSIEEPKAVTSR